MINVFIRKIENLSAEEITQIISSLSENAKLRLNKKKNDTLRLASLCSLSLLTKEQRGDLAYTKSGIPCFKSIDKKISISHSNVYAAVAISDLDVGIDVEEITEKESSSKLVRFFTENEKKQVECGYSPIEIWTKKEALFKHLKNDDINFISLDTTQADICFTTTYLDSTILTICHKSQEEINIQKL